MHQRPVLGAEHPASAADAGLYGHAYSQSAAGGWRQLDDNAQWTGPSTLECSTMEGRRVVIDVAHYPTALQVCDCFLMFTALPEVPPGLGPLLSFAVLV